MNWATVPIGRACEDTTFEDPSTRPFFRYIDISSIDRVTKAIIETAEIAGVEAPSRARKAIRTGDVLVSTVRPNLNAVAIVPDDLDGEIASTGFSVLRPKRGQLAERFLYYYCCTARFIDSLTAKVRGAQYPAVSAEDVKDVEIPLPPLSEQRRIVEILDQADRLRRLRAEADAKADRILPVLYRKLFLDRASNWPKEPLGTRLRRAKGALQSGPFGSHLHNSDFVESGPIRVVGIDNVLDGEFSLGRNRRITTEKYEELHKYTLEPGDILVTIMGTVGRTCVFPQLREPAICTKHVYRIQVDERLNPEYVSASMRFAPAVRGQLGASITGQIVAGINSEDIRRLELSIPPTELQDCFAAHAGTLAQQRTQRRRAVARLDRLFATLLRDAFSGELTAHWREANMNELLQEMEQHATALTSPARTE